MIENDKTLPQLLGQACSVEILESLVKSRLQLLDQMIFALDKSIHADDITNLQTEIVVLQGDDRLAAFTIVANQHNESWRNKNRKQSEKLFERDPSLMVVVCGKPRKKIEKGVQIRNKPSKKNVKANIGFEFICIHHITHNSVHSLVKYQ